MKGIYKLLVLFLAFTIWTIPACGYDWLIREYCSEVQRCDPTVYGNEDYCFNYLKNQVDQYPECEYEFEDFYECDMDMLCKGNHYGENNCYVYERKLTICTGKSPYDENW